MAEKRSADKLEMILSAAQKRFHHFGLTKTTMNDIAEDIGMSKASLYYYFRDKESIFAAVVKREQEHFGEEMEKLIAKKGQAEWMLIEYVNMRIELLRKTLLLSKLNSDNLREVKPLFKDLFTAFRKRELSLIRAILENGNERGEFSTEQVKKQSEFFLDTLRAIRQSALYSPVGEMQIELSAQKITYLKNQSRMFTEMFINHIKNNR